MQSAHKSGLATYAVIEAVAQRLDDGVPSLRRRWPGEAKARILQEAMAPGVNVSAVARAHGLSAQQLFTWRRKAMRSGAISLLSAGCKGEVQSFTPVEVTRAAGGGGVEIVIGDATIRVGNGVAPTLLLEAIRAVRSA